MHALATVSSGPRPPLIETSTDPNLDVLLWLWRRGRNPYVPRGVTFTLASAAPFGRRLLRVNVPITVYDTTVDAGRRRVLPSGGKEG